ncbi:uncharacterized protein LOC143900525 [Temnothorax americanus]|uniref:uncharacterized protein LOC143900525 n=1 Tax=Temnothorax americanus TaxID=1964332 RepID=UPI004068156E
MPGCCCVPKCKKTTMNGFHLFRFPLNRPDILKLWVNAIERENFKPTKHRGICSAHFLTTDFMDRPGRSGVRLKNLAAPSVFFKDSPPVSAAVVTSNIESGSIRSIKSETTSATEFGVTPVPTSAATAPAVAWKSIPKPKENDSTFCASIPSPSTKPAGTSAAAADTIEMTARKPRKIMDSSLIRLRKREETLRRNKQMLRMIKTMRQKTKRKEDKIRFFENLLKYVRGKTTSNVAEVAVFSRDGDSGLTITDAGDTKPKDDVIFNALGATDELSSYIGLAREFACDGKVEHPYVDKLKRVQMILVDLSHAISKSVPGKTRSFESKHTKDLEEWILEYSNQLPPPEDYIIPGGGKACASLHVARTVCRRAERSITTLVRDGALDKEAQMYLNRLSDFLLTVSRIAAKCDQRTENIYIPRAEVTEEK